MQRIKKKAQLDGWSRLRSPEIVMALIERFDQVELVEYIFTQAMFNSLSVAALTNGERHDLIHGFWSKAFDQLAPMEASSSLSVQAQKARLRIDVFARACLDALAHYEFIDPKTRESPYQYPVRGSE